MQNITVFISYLFDHSRPIVLRCLLIRCMHNALIQTEWPMNSREPFICWMDFQHCDFSRHEIYCIFCTRSLAHLFIYTIRINGHEKLCRKTNLRHDEHVEIFACLTTFSKNVSHTIGQTKLAASKEKNVNKIMKTQRNTHFRKRKHRATNDLK